MNGLMQKTTRPNQRSIYLDEDTKRELDEFANRYPLLPFSMVVNVALRRYFDAAKGGIDGNLQPLNDH